MAVTNESSAEYLKQTDPRTNGVLDPQNSAQKVYKQEFNFTQGAAAGDDGSGALLLQLPPGRVKFYPLESAIQWSAFGASRVLDVGVAAYVGEDGVTVAAAPVAFDTDIDVSSAGKAKLGSDVAAATGAVFEYNSTEGVDVVVLCTGGTIPAAATLKGYLTYAVVGA